jgi:hypothetical protein
MLLGTILETRVHRCLVLPSDFSSSDWPPSLSYRVTFSFVVASTSISVVVDMDMVH